nr:replication protein A 70 kDa DNA-binding subunit B [Tanacetum cinerariifolium]
MASINALVLVKDLTAIKEIQNICVKVDKTWKQSIYGKLIRIENLELIFIDKEFVDFEKILNNHVIDNGRVDIIGYLTGYGDLELM